MKLNNYDRATQSPALAVRIETVKLFSKGTLRAFLDFELLGQGLVIRGATVHEKDGTRWLSLPVKEWDKGGKSGRAPIVEAPDRRVRAQLQAAVFAALDAFQAAGKGGAE